MSWVLSQLESSRLLVIQGGHLTTRKSHCKAAVNRIMCWGGGEGERCMFWSPSPSEGLNLGERQCIWAQGLSQELGWDLSHSLGPGTSSGYQLSPCSILRQGGCGKGVRRALGLCIEGTISCPGVQGSPSPGNHLPVLLQTHHSWVLWLWASYSIYVNFSLLNHKIWVTAPCLPSPQCWSQEITDFHHYWQLSIEIPNCYY